MCVYVCVYINTHTHTHTHTHIYIKHFCICVISEYLKRTWNNFRGNETLQHIPVSLEHSALRKWRPFWSLPNYQLYLVWGSGSLFFFFFFNNTNIIALVSKNKWGSIHLPWLGVRGRKNYYSIKKNFSFGLSKSQNGRKSTSGDATSSQEMDSTAVVSDTIWKSGPSWPGQLFSGPNKPDLT